MRGQSKYKDTKANPHIKKNLTNRYNSMTNTNSTLLSLAFLTPFYLNRT